MGKSDESSAMIKNQPVILRTSVRVYICAFSVSRQKLGDQRIHLPETLHSCIAWIPVLVLKVVRQPG